MSYEQKLATGKGSEKMIWQKQKTVCPLFFAFCFLFVALCSVFYPDDVISGSYLDSAHGNTSYGVIRNAPGFPADYSKGNCAYCHEQHASIGGTEPNPTGGPDKYALFYSNYISQTDGFCLECHTDTSPYQTGGLVNRSYGYRAGGYTADTLNDVKEAFSFITPATSHNLADIITFINGRWGYTSDSNGCAACHNPHRAKGDPANSPNGSKSSVTRSYSPVSRTSLHSRDNNAWGLWGANSSERMNFYASSKGGFYQAPYFYGSSSTFEPDGSGTQDGSNLTDSPTFCTDCHNGSNVIYGHTIVHTDPTGGPLRTGDNLYQFDFSQEMHGGYAANYCHGTTTNLFVPPYDGFRCPQNYVLSCTDCHEPHGSPNNYLVRNEVNNGAPLAVTHYGDFPDSGETSGYYSKEWINLCEKCHTHLYADGIHTHPNSVTQFPAQFQNLQCGTGGTSGGFCCYCHSVHGGPMYRNCQNCHFHGNRSLTIYISNAWQTVDYGKPLF